MPARAVTVIASRSTCVIPASFSGRSRTPSAAAIAVNEWPVPTIFTVRPAARAATTASATSGTSRGVSTCCGLTVTSPLQFVQVLMDEE